MVKLIDILSEIDYHSKLSPGHKPNWRQLHTSKFIPYDELDELVTDSHIICNKCKWSWTKASGGNDLYNCHKCGHDNTPVEENTAPDHDGKAAPYGSGYDEVEENFADGKNPGRKGISKRVGIPKGATLTQLAKLAKSKGEKGRMARWQLNMRRGKKKK